MAAAPEDRPGWRKSSYSGGSGSTDCIEVRWHKSSRSGNPNTACVEVAVGVERVGVRDSKNVGGPRLAFSAGDWRKFLGRLA